MFARIKEMRSFQIPFLFFCVNREHQTPPPQRKSRQKRDERAAGQCVARETEQTSVVLIQSVNKNRQRCGRSR